MKINDKVVVSLDAPFHAGLEFYFQFYGTGVSGHCAILSRDFFAPMRPGLLNKLQQVNIVVVDRSMISIAPSSK